jgi:hypothetical protein
MLQSVAAWRIALLSEVGDLGTGSHSIYTNQEGGLSLLVFSTTKLSCLDFGFETLGDAGVGF